ncbi:MAG TPA: TatD family hydrolase [Candidatus Saccharimonadales bacterium]|nr:TatD family hydrolase [Candidatus Saccharimonadales bacterium]
MELVDTHCHIQSIGQRRGERITRQMWEEAGVVYPDVVIADAVTAKVTRLICVGCDPSDSKLAVEFVQHRLNCWAAIGIHPHESKHYADKTDELQVFAALADQPNVVAVGECGLDFHHKHSKRDDQLKVLKFQIELALSKNLPLIFHVREAFDDFWPVFESYQGIRGVLHSFTDSADNLNKALNKGLYIGVNGIATFTKDEELLTVLKSVPLDRMVLETDSPFLSPNPKRGRINVPKNIAEVAKHLAESRGLTLTEISSSTTDNARQLFGI